MKNTNLTAEQLKEKKDKATFNRRFSGFKRTIKHQIQEKGIIVFVFILNILKTTPTHLCQRSISPMTKL